MMLKRDLKRMGCYILLEQTWCLRNEAMVGKLTTKKSAR